MIVNVGLCENKWFKVQKILVLFPCRGVAQRRDVLTWLIVFAFQSFSEKRRKTILLLFGDNELKMTRKSRKKQKENLAGCTGEGIR